MNSRDAYIARYIKDNGKPPRGDEVSSPKVYKAPRVGEQDSKPIVYIGLRPRKRSTQYVGTF